MEPVVAGELGVKRGAEHVALAHHHAHAVALARATRTSGPARSIHGARMKIAGNARRAERRNRQGHLAPIRSAVRTRCAER